MKKKIHTYTRPRVDQVARDPNLGDRRIAPPDLGFRTRRGGWGMTSPPPREDAGVEEMRDQ